MICPKCNAKVLETLKVCPNCGNIFETQDLQNDVITPVETETQTTPVINNIEEKTIIGNPIQSDNIQTEQYVQTKNNETEKHKPKILKCIVVPLLISVIVFFATTITKLIIGVESTKAISIVQITLPILIIIFGPIIMYVIEINKK